MTTVLEANGKPAAAVEENTTTLPFPPRQVQDVNALQALKAILGTQVAILEELARIRQALTLKAAPPAEATPVKSEPVRAKGKK